jgi:cAMP-dependent protein kinase regulator
LALLYNAPRAATIIADTNCVLYQLDRSTFNHIVKDSSIKKRKRYEDFLSTVEVLNSLNYMEKLKLADALKPEDKEMFSMAVDVAEKLYDEEGSVKAALAKLPAEYASFKDELEQHLTQKFEG